MPFSFFSRLKYLESLIYDFLVSGITSEWYREVLQECRPGVKMLDIGIGTATSLIKNSDILISKRINVTGVEYNPAYVRKANIELAKSNAVQYFVHIVHTDIRDFNKDRTETFDVIYFSGSFMTLQNQSEILKHCVSMLRNRISKDENSCNIFFSQTFEKHTLFGNFIAPLIKRVLSFLTTIDFGITTYEDQFKALLNQAGVEIIRIKVMKNSYFRSQVVVMARPKLHGVDT